MNPQTILTDKEQETLRTLVSQDEKEMLFLCFRGSVSHGTYVPSDNPSSVDDVDLIGVTVGGIDEYLGLRFTAPKPVEMFIDRLDVVLYDIRHFLHLLVKGNPNVLGTLWTRPEMFVRVTPLGQDVLDHRELFVSKSAYSPFIGYAYSQLKKMRSPDRKGYLGEKRRKLIEQFGYDPKNAAHLIRLLSMGIEFLKTGFMIVDRTDVDAEHLLSIKRGEWSLEKVERTADELFKVARMAYEQSSLPERPDTRGASQLAMETILAYNYDRIREVV